jgi:hypothetical protein
MCRYIQETAETGGVGEAEEGYDVLRDAEDTQAQN